MKGSRIPVAQKVLKEESKNSQTNEIVSVSTFDRFKGMERRLHGKVLAIVAQNADILTNILKVKKDIQNVQEIVTRLEKVNQHGHSIQNCSPKAICPEVETTYLNEFMLKPKKPTTPQLSLRSLLIKTDPIKNESFVDAPNLNSESPIKGLNDDVDMKSEENSQGLIEENISLNSSIKKDGEDETKCRNNIFDWLKKLPSDLPSENTVSRSPPLHRLSKQSRDKDNPDETEIESDFSISYSQSASNSSSGVFFEIEESVESSSSDSIGIDH